MELGLPPSFPKAAKKQQKRNKTIKKERKTHCVTARYFDTCTNHRLVVICGLSLSLVFSFPWDFLPPQGPAFKSLVLCGFSGPTSNVGSLSKYHELS